MFALVPSSAPPSASSAATASNEVGVKYSRAQHLINSTRLRLTRHIPFSEPSYLTRPFSINNNNSSEYQQQQQEPVRGGWESLRHKCDVTALRVRAEAAGKSVNSATTKMLMAAALTHSPVRTTHLQAALLPLCHRCVITFLISYRSETVHVVLFLETPVLCKRSDHIF